MTTSRRARDDAKDGTFEMSTNHSTRRQRDARRLAKTEGIKYTEALRRVSAESSRHATVLFVVSALGGAGKSTTALALAGCAASAGIKTMVVDASRYGDIRPYLRLGTVRLPSIGEVVDGAPAHEAIVSPTAASKARAGLPPVGFSVVLGSESVQERWDGTSAEVLNQVVDAASEVSELVIVDTDPGWGEIVYPRISEKDTWVLMLASEGWSIAQTRVVLDEFAATRRPTDRVLVATTRCNPRKPKKRDVFASRLRDHFSDVGAFVGTTLDSTELRARHGNREFPHDDPAVHDVVMNTLRHVTGSSAFNAHAAEK